MTRLGNIAAAATAQVAAAAFLLLGVAQPAFGLGASDGTPPAGAVGGVRTPASGALELRLNASDAGAGLAGAEASLGDGPASFVRLGSGSCPEHPATGSEPPSGAECPASVFAVPLTLDTRTVGDGEHELRVRVTDAVGNTATLVDQGIVVRNAARTTGTRASVAIGLSSGAESASASVGGGGPSSPPPPRPPGPLGHCRSPQLRMRLAAKPLWRTRHRHLPVLRFRRRHLYKGRLTCLVSGHRVSAPNGTPVQIFYRIWRRTFRPHKGSLKVRKGTIRVRNGGLRVKLGFLSGRVIIFRYQDPAGLVARSKVRIAIARPDPPSKEKR